MTQQPRTAQARTASLGAARRELSAALAILEDADGLAALACPHLCEGWLHVVQAAGAAGVELDGLCDALEAQPPAGLDDEERRWLRERMPALVDATREQLTRLEPPVLPLAELRRHARLLHAALLAA
jgi:hypothetical protein